MKIFFILFFNFICVVAQTDKEIWDKVAHYCKKGEERLDEQPGAASIDFREAKKLIDLYFSRHKIRNEDDLYAISFVYNNYGKSLILIDRVEEGTKLRKVVLNLFEKIYQDKNSFLFSQILNNMGYTYAVRSEFDKSYQYYKRAFNMQKALQLEHSKSTKNLETYAKTLNNMGSAHERLGDDYLKSGDTKKSFAFYKEAQNYYTKSLNLKNKIFKEYVESISKTEINIADCYIKMGAIKPKYIETAHEKIGKTLSSMYKNLNNKKSSTFSKAYISKIEVSFKRNELKHIPEYVEKLYKIQKNFLENNTWAGATLHKQRMWKEQLQLPLNLLLSTLSSEVNSQDYIKRAFICSVYTKSVINCALKAERQFLTQLKGKSSKSSNFFETYKKIVSQISDVTYSSDKKVLKAYNDFEQKIFNLEQAISQKFKRYYEDPELTEKQLIQLQEKLKEDSIFLEWIEFEDWNNNKQKSLGCFVVTHKGIRFVTLPDSPKKVYKLIHKIRRQIKLDLLELKNNWNKAIIAKKSTEKALETLKEAENRLLPKLAELKNILWMPINDISLKVRNVVVAPCGDLHLIPWAIFPDKSQKAYSVEHYNFSYCSSAKDLQEEHSVENSVATNGILCIGDPALYSKKEMNDEQLAMRNIRSSVTWAVCNYFKQELQEAKESSLELFSKEGELVHGKNATKANFKQKAPNADILHIVSHATMIKSNDEEKMMEKFPLLKNRFLNSLLRASILFSKNGVGVGYMTALEISTLNLSQVQCVIISCCSTGDIIPEDAFGFLGFRWAFRQAGAKRTLSNLWDVLDKESAKIMKHFYTEYRTWTSYSFAVNECQREFLKNNKAYTHPGVWGYIICDGVPDFDKKKEDDMEEEEEW
ncbi:CHAT domain-containing protein [Candidatus Uabimicrobium amorphum]|uniref:CHAT domain-containing protein n=1 Tax=Uabimicrobium amorphum TaxID=2596890 RepID=A0A5S9IS43_UABAM|nr:CHAT domain-containing tetratricopeptide repeat protein [Candidatus Uabimicrobium amorphum]BBM87138.1 hypothetical protein UABAM_05541 [Candidatus Uabimicrobium amorphum]